MEHSKPISSTAGQINYKNRLQEHAQRSAAPLPLYQTVNIGAVHAPKFKSTVTVDGETFESSTTFFHRKKAEQDVARVALEGIPLILKNKGVPLIQNDTMFCKSILYEYSVKMKIEKPIYTTAESKGLFTLFVTSVTFDGKTYAGGKGTNKKEAVQIAARAVIESILGSDTGTIMSQIIKSKGRLYAAMDKGNVENHSIDSNAKAKELQSAMPNDKLPSVAYAEPLSFGQTANATVVNSIPFNAINPKEEVCELSGLGGSLTSLPSVQQKDPTVESTVTDEPQSMGSNRSRKRSNKNNRSRSKKTRTAEQSLVSAETVTQAASTTMCVEAVAQGA